MSVQKNKQRESPAGFHYINLYQCCPRRWYMLYVKGWRPQFTAKPLIMGAAYHLGTALWYEGKSEKVCIKRSLEYVESMKAEMESSEDFEDVLFRVKNLVHYWIERLGAMDRQEYKVVAVEKQLKVPIGDKFIMTIRPDAIIQHKATGLYYIQEKKTSSFSKRLTEEGVMWGDQATAYIWGVKKVLGIEVDGVIPDIAYWNKTTRSIANIEFIRGDIVRRTPYQIELFESNMAQLFSEVTQKILALDSKKYRADILFPRNSHYCMSYFSLCPYAAVCNTDVQKKRGVPQGFRKEVAKELGSVCWDDLGV